MSALAMVLSGPSSSGKTSLAQAIQGALPGSAVLVEADRAFPVLSGEGPSRREAVLTFHRSIAVWLSAGFDLILDGSLPYGDDLLINECLRVFEPFDLRLVGVTCEVDVLAKREKDRPEPRPLGWAARQARDIHDGMRYDCVIDTTRRTADDCACDVLAQLGLHR